MNIARAFNFIKPAAVAGAKFWNRHKTTIIKFVATGSVVGFGVTCVKGTVEAKPKLDKLREEYPEKIPVKELAKEIAPCYAPSLLFFAMSVGGIFGLDYAHVQKEAMLTGLYGTAQTTFAEYQKKVQEKLGEETEKEINKSVVQERVNNNDPFSQDGIALICGKGDRLCYDPFNGRWFWCTEEKLKKAETNINRRLAAHDWVSVNDFFNGELDLPSVTVGDNLGWNIMNDDRVEIKITESDVTATGLSYLIVEFDRFHFPKPYNY